MTTVNAAEVVATSPPPAIPWESLSWTGSDWDGRSGAALTAQEILSRVTDPTLRLDVYFLPRVEEFSKHKTLTAELARVFNTPAFFWKEIGWEANGFFNCQHSGTAICSSSRFLIKKLIPVGAVYEYAWDYLAFLSLSHPVSAQEGRWRRILLCFDLSDTLTALIKQRFQETSVGTEFECVFGVYTILIPVIASVYDESVWSYRKPVRDIEKTRPDAGQEPQLKRERRVAMAGRYKEMHDLARHIIHIREVVEVAAATIRLMESSHTSWDSQCGSCHPQLQALAFWGGYLHNLSLRANAFDERLRNEITLAFNLIAAEDNSVAKEILKETRNDGRDLTNLVSLLSLIFLPLSFFSGFFGMNFFIGSADGTLQKTRDWLLFFKISAPFTVGAIIVWLLYRYRRSILHWLSPPPPLATRPEEKKEIGIVRAFSMPADRSQGKRERLPPPQSYAQQAKDKGQAATKPELKEQVLPLADDTDSQSGSFLRKGKSSTKGENMA